MAAGPEITQLPTELDYPIALNLGYRDVLALCTTSSRYARLCEDNIFWQLKARQDFNVSKDEFVNGMTETANTGRLRYLQLLTDNGDVVIGSERFAPVGVLLVRTIVRDDPSLTNYFLLQLSPEDRELTLASRDNDTDGIMAALRKGTRIPDPAFIWAVINNDIDNVIRLHQIAVDDRIKRPSMETLERALVIATGNDEEIIHIITTSILALQYTEYLSLGGTPFLPYF